MLGRAQLLDAAEEVFGRKGFHEATLREVAELAEFSVGSVYSFFDSKEDLFRQVFVRRGDEFMPGIRAAVAAASADPVASLHELVDFEVGFFRERPHFGRLYLRHASVGNLAIAEEEAAVVDNRSEAMELEADLFRRGQEAGRFRPGDPEVLARLFTGLMVAFQAQDPAVVADDRHGPERFTLAELHDLVEAAFVPA